MNPSHPGYIVDTVNNVYYSRGMTNTVQSMKEIVTVKRGQTNHYLDVAAKRTLCGVAEERTKRHIYPHSGASCQRCIRLREAEYDRYCATADALVSVEGDTDDYWRSEG